MWTLLQLRPSCVCLVYPRKKPPKRACDIRHRASLKKSLPATRSAIESRPEIVQLDQTIQN